MRRFLTVAMLATTLGALLLPGAATAQGWNPCGDYADSGTVPGGYELVIGGNGGSGSQMIIGSEGADTLRGRSGNDILCGFGGNDTLIGGSGNDFIDGGGDSDLLRGNSGNDTLANGETNREGSGNDEVITIEPEPAPVTIELTYITAEQKCDVTATRTNVDEYHNINFKLYVNGSYAYTLGTSYATVTFSYTDPYDPEEQTVNVGDEVYVTLTSTHGSGDAVIATSETEICGA